jgi:hypothetical protein
MDDEVPGEDPQTAGEFIIVLDLDPIEEPAHSDVQFDPPVDAVPATQ